MIDRQETIDTVYVTPDIKEVEKVIIDNLYIGDQKVVDLVASGRLCLVGFCNECKHFYYGLEAVIDGESRTVTPPRCSLWCAYVKETGWCYKFEQEKRLTNERT